jgi:hypothetical protein
MPRKNRSPNLWTPLAKKHRRSTKPAKDKGPPLPPPPRKPVVKRAKTSANAETREGWD